MIRQWKDPGSFKLMVMLSTETKRKMHAGLSKKLSLMPGSSVLQRPFPTGTTSNTEETISIPPESSPPTTATPIAHSSPFSYSTSPSAVEPIAATTPTRSSESKSTNNSNSASVSSSSSSSSSNDDKHDSTDDKELDTFLDMLSMMVGRQSAEKALYNNRIVTSNSNDEDSSLVSLADLENLLFELMKTE